jgi:coenzyme F420-0:L-glutamate ligase/coenzyme F420-1:gamma-L-glutamate ligase
MSSEVRIIGVADLPEISPGTDLAEVITTAAQSQGITLTSGDILVVTQKIVSKAEGRLVDIHTVTPSAFACQIARLQEKDPRIMEVVLRETKRVVKMDQRTVIAETHHGFVCANAGVDESNGFEPGMLTLLPKDSDASAERLRAALAARFGVDIAVVVTDTFGRPWREGLVEVALGCAGMDPLLDLRGRADLAGRELHHTVVGLADTVAAASGLVMEKDSRVAAAIVRGVRYAAPTVGPAAQRMIRRPDLDLFR